MGLVMIDGKDYLERLNDQQIIAKCLACGIRVALPFTSEQQDAWEGGALLQRITPNLDDDNREIMISGTCGPCFDKLFEGAE